MVENEIGKCIVDIAVRIHRERCRTVQRKLIISLCSSVYLCVPLCTSVFLSVSSVVNP